MTQEQPKPGDAVLGNREELKPQPADAVLGSYWHPERELTTQETLRIWIMQDPKLEPLVAHALASLIQANDKPFHS